MRSESIKSMIEGLAFSFRRRSGGKYKAWKERELLRLRNVCVKDISHFGSVAAKNFVKNFLAHVGHDRRSSANSDVMRPETSGYRHGREWHSPEVIPDGLGRLLSGYVVDLATGRQRITSAKRADNKELRFILLLWDWLKLNQGWLKVFVQTGTIYDQCGKRLYYWPYWKTVNKHLVSDFPGLAAGYDRDVQVLREFSVRIRRGKNHG